MAEFSRGDVDSDNGADVKDFTFAVPPSQGLPLLNPLLAKATVVEASPKGNEGGQAQNPKPLKVVPIRPSRNKVPLEKGFSQVEWLRMSQTTDLAGQGGKLRRDITLEEVQKHKTEHDAWIILRGKVYNIGPYLNFHPGGASILLKAAGTDGTSLFNKYHAWVNADMLLQSCLLGIVGRPADEA
eukprot:jgi/Botrbrau1/12719/Bobra.67_1s0082.1